jgi:HK97 family phage prohead protease
MAEKTFILSDQSVNRYGFRVLTDGIALEAFLANPVMLYNHHNDVGDASSEAVRMPIGKWVNIRKENGQLLAEPEYDVDDTLAMRVKAKVDKGYLNTCSIAFDISEMSEEVIDLATGQVRPTVMKSELLECSITPVPANSKCITLADNKGNRIELNGSGKDIDKLTSILPLINTKPDMDLKNIATTLGLPETATEADIEAAIAKQKTDLQALQTANTNQLALNKKQMAASLVETALAAGKLQPAEKDNMVKLAENDFDTVKAMLDAKPVHVSITQQLANRGTGANTGAADGRANWTFNDYHQKDPVALALIKDKTPDEYKKLYDLQFSDAKKYIHE